MTTALVLSVTALIVAALALIATLLQRKTLRALTQQLKSLEAKLQEKLPDVKSAAPLTSGFSAHLHDAEKIQQQGQQELKEKLQKSNTVKPQVQADKYRYAVALAAQGQSVDSIAQALNMAPAEVEQVMQLARVKRPA